MKLAFLGGSFNPVHNAHIMLAVQAANQYAYDTVLLIPAWQPPHKKLAEGASAQERLAMLNAALKEIGDKRLHADDCELKRGGVSYTIDTLHFLKKRFAAQLEGKIGIILGSDLIDGFAKWKQADLLAREADLLLALRPVAEIEDDAEAGKGGKASGAGKVQDFLQPHKILHNNLYDISSKRIRRLIAQNGEWKDLVPQSVYRYISERNLYGFK